MGSLARFSPCCCAVASLGRRWADRRRRPQACWAPTCWRPVLRIGWTEALIERAGKKQPAYPSRLPSNFRHAGEGRLRSGQAAAMNRSRLQTGRGMAPGHHCRACPFPGRPLRRSGARNGLLARASNKQRPGLDLLRLDNLPGRPARLDPGPPTGSPGDLNLGCRPTAGAASLLDLSSFCPPLAEQARAPALGAVVPSCFGPGRLAGPGGFPTAGKFCQWRQPPRRLACPAAPCPCPGAAGLVELASGTCGSNASTTALSRQVRAP